MNNKKVLTPNVIKLLKDILSSIFWYKKSLTDFIRNSMDDGYKFLSIIDVNNITKREIASHFIDRLMLQENQKKYHDDIINIIDNLCGWNNFAELEKTDRYEQINEAKKNIINLKSISHSFLEIKVNEIKKQEAQERYIQNQEAKQYFINQLDMLKNEYFEILKLMPQQRGYRFEKLLYKLSNLFDLDPKASYKNVGEQIDGAFCFETQEYLLEAKFYDKPIDHTHVVLFMTKVSKKLDTTLGILISNSGFTETAINNANDGKRNILLMDGEDLFFVLENRISYTDLLKHKKRHAAQTGNSYLKVREILI